MLGTAEVKDRIAGIYADGWSRIVATMIQFTGGWDLADDATQTAINHPCLGGCVVDARSVAGRTKHRAATCNALHMTGSRM